MKILQLFIKLIIIIGLSFSTTFLLDLAFIQNNWMRYGLVVLVIIIILFVGFKYIITEIKKL